LPQLQRTLDYDGGDDLVIRCGYRYPAVIVPKICAATA
jgi:hypothetical protein